MPNYYDGTDILWDGTVGDFVIDNKGDLADTSHDALQAIAQYIYTVVKSDRGDWPEASRVGATLSDFVGEPNNAENGANIKKRLTTALQAYGTIKLSDVFVDVVPISKEQVAVTLSLSVMPTARNKSSRVIKRTYIYSYLENHTYGR